MLLPGIISELVACNEKGAMRHLAINHILDHLLSLFKYKGTFEILITP